MERKPQGFTLLEVLVATAIMAIAVTGLLTSLSTSLRNAARVTSVDRATLLARQKMDELLSEPKLPKGTILEGGWDPSLTGGVKAGWRAQVTDFEKPPGAIPGSQVLERIELEVWWETNGNRQTFRLEGYRPAKLIPGREQP